MTSGELNQEDLLKDAFGLLQQMNNGGGVGGRNNPMGQMMNQMMQMMGGMNGINGMDRGKGKRMGINKDKLRKVQQNQRLKEKLAKKNGDVE